jgi:predicted transcriptional regulator
MNKRMSADDAITGNSGFIRMSIALKKKEMGNMIFDERAKH